MLTPNFVNQPPLKVEFSINDTLSNSGYSNTMLQLLYIHFINLYWHRKFTNWFAVPLTLQHIVYWRSQIKFLGSDLIRRNLLSVEQLNEDIRFALLQPATQTQKMVVGLNKARS